MPCRSGCPHDVCGTFHAADPPAGRDSWASDPSGPSATKLTTAPHETKTRFNMPDLLPRFRTRVILPVAYADLRTNARNQRGLSMDRDDSRARPKYEDGRCHLWAS